MQVYQSIAKHFDETRVAYWKAIREVLDDLVAGTLVLDCGCGNGKYSRYRKDLTFISFDITPALVNIAKDKNSSNSDYFLGSCQFIPVRDLCVDMSICVAVLHHIIGYENRLAVVKELLRCTKEKAIITVWADEQTKKDKWVHQGGTDYMVPWFDKYTGQTFERLYHLFSRAEIDQLCNDLGIAGRVKVWYECDNWIVFIQK